ncbi:MAG: serine hydrolase, partial [Corynebacterium sp.]|uniref:serine hydrolase n=1 Tax=Corynebacterium sp. TaxID=1720 RepID=UPI003F958108
WTGVATGSYRYTTLEDATTPAGRITLDSLLTHTSGLPTIGGGRGTILGTNWRLIRGRDPQPEGLASLIQQLRKAPVKPDVFEYSNLGGAALGHALAAAAGATYPDLIARYLGAPLQCPTLYVPEPGMPDGPHDAPGLSIFNRTQEPWTGAGYAPAGGIRASAADLAILLDALLNHPLPGWTDAFTPRSLVDAESFIGPGNSIGAGWFIQDDGLIWHNGYAGGFGSVIVLDRRNRRGAAVSVIDGTMRVDPVPIALSLNEVA